MEDLDLMKWEVEKANKSFNIKYRLGIWSKRSYETDDQAADIHLERVKGKKSAKAAVNTQEEKAIAALLQNETKHKKNALYCQFDSSKHTKRRAVS